MFPGQGAQYVSMGAVLYRSEPVFQAEIDHCAELLQPLLKTDLRNVIFPAEESDKEAEQLLVQTRFTQPALFVLEYALAQLWMSWGIKPAAMIGHSVGEYVAGCLAGVFTLEDACHWWRNVPRWCRRSRAGRCSRSGCQSKQFCLYLMGVWRLLRSTRPIYAWCPAPNDVIAALETELGSRGVMARRLQTSHAFHSAMMEPVLAPFTEVLRRVKLCEPHIPYVSNVTAGWITGAEAKSPEYWAGHVRQTVRFADGVANS